MLFQILEKTPFSIQYFPSEPFRPIGEWQLQAAEYDLKLNKTHYYEHAVRVGNRFGYPREIAERIAEYWRKRWSFAEYQLSEVEPRLTMREADVLVRCVDCGALLETDVHCDSCGTFHPTRR